MTGTYGVILCGDNKMEMQAHTNIRSPSLINIKENYSVLDKQIFQFKCADIKKVVMIAKSECYAEIESYTRKYEGIDVEVYEENRGMGSVGAIDYALEMLNGDIVMRNADIVSDINLKKFIDTSKVNNYPVTIYVTKLPSPYGVVRLRSDYVMGFEEKPIIDKYINAGIYYFKSDIELPETYKSGKIESTIFPEIANKRMMGYYEEDVFWRSVKTVYDLELIQKEYLEKTDKAWGYEKLLVHTDKYMTKELFLREGFQTSYHQHEEKDETMYVNRGRGYIKFDDHVEYYSKSDKIHILPRTPHSIVALDNTLLYEFSTPHIDDTTRIRDFYPRDTE
ncbi:MAG: glucose-1-phosphate adenylyltransferase [Candidatus Methanofastidiosa archaeon]|nr:glucose-1-phosphate adenylyltransferase [Candidatus Methanofastidiosa archaeon]